MLGTRTLFSDRVTPAMCLLFAKRTMTRLASTDDKRKKNSARAHHRSHKRFSILIAPIHPHAKWHAQTQTTHIASQLGDHVSGCAHQQNEKRLCSLFCLSVFVCLQ